MNDSESGSLSSGDSDPALRFLIEFQAELEAGRPITAEQFVAERVPPELRAEVTRRLAAFARARSKLDDARAQAEAQAQTPKPGSPSDSESRPDPRLGMVFGDFQIEKRLGKGGMGVVYLAQQRGLGRLVALKILEISDAERRHRRERFGREASAPARLRHPAIVKILSEGETDGVCWYAMEFVDGKTLGEILAALRAEDSRAERKHEGRNWTTVTLEVVAEIADALDEAHRAGIVHRDIKPQNLLIDRHCKPHLIDFGVALDSGGSDLTKTGDMVGSLHYMSPEQVHALKDGRIDHRTDVYSLGVVLYEMLTLRRPFDGATKEQIYFAIAFKTPLSVRRLAPKISVDLQTVCTKAIEKRREDRYASAADFARDLRHVLQHEAIEARPPPWHRKAVRLVRANKLAVAAFLVGVLACTAAAIAWSRHLRWKALPQLILIPERSQRSGDGLVDPTGARVFLRRIDGLQISDSNGIDPGPVKSVSVESGPPEELGRLPLQEKHLEPGQYTIVVEKDDAFAEMTRVVGDAPTVPIHVWLRKTAAVTAKDDIVRVPGSDRVKVGQEDPTDPVFNYRMVRVGPLWVSRFKVTNREFKGFVDATHRTGVGAKWRAVEGAGLRLPPDYWDLPATDVTWLDAVEYAEWAGMRLATSEEWDLAARSVEGFKFPWGQDAGRIDEVIAPVADTFLIPPEFDQQFVDNCLRFFKPVHRPGNPDVSATFALVDTISNAREWTQSVYREWDRNTGSVRLFEGEFFVRGGSFRSYRENWVKTRPLETYSAEFGTRNPLDVGFRCVKSVIP